MAINLKSAPTTEWQERYNMNNKEYIKNQFGKEWYAQSTNATPFFIGACAHSGFSMKPILGYGYTKFLFHYKKEWGEMHYYTPDLDRLWKIIKKNIAKDLKYLYKIKKEYDKSQIKDFKRLKELEKEAKDASEEQLVAILKEAYHLADMVNISHAIEPVGLRSEEDLKAILEKKIRNKKEFNKAFAILSTPTKLSYLAKEENGLNKISKMPKSWQGKLLKKHAKKYRWIQNSYAGASTISVNSFEKRIKDGLKNTSIKGIKEKREKLMNKLKFSQKEKELVEQINLVTIWQDERKANINKGISILDSILNEIAKKTNIPKPNLRYLLKSDVHRIKSFKDILKLKTILAERRKGVFVIEKDGTDFAVSGKDYEELIKQYKKKEEKTETQLNGSVANPGTALGEAKICHNIASLKKMRSGDVLVASMTRPEYMSAIKKAAAIVTDEGGITCHAAIVSRELNIPCVVGTKVATKVFKDGNKIEVRANHGMVRKIK